MKESIIIVSKFPSQDKTNIPY